MPNNHQNHVSPSHGSSKERLAAIFDSLRDKAMLNLCRYVIKIKWNVFVPIVIIDSILLMFDIDLVISYWCVNIFLDNTLNYYKLINNVCFPNIFKIYKNSHDKNIAYSSGVETIWWRIQGVLHFLVKDLNDSLLWLAVLYGSVVPTTTVRYAVQ